MQQAFQGEHLVRIPPSVRLVGTEQTIEPLRCGVPSSIKHQLTGVRSTQRLHLLLNDSTRSTSLISVTDYFYIPFNSDLLIYQSIH